MENARKFTVRNGAIDMLRGLTVLIMIFVNSFWKLEGVPHWLEHAAWGEDFMGLADIVFPCFLFAVGMSIPYAIERRSAKGFSDASTLLHILLRTFALLVTGAFLGNSEGWISDDAPYPMGLYWILMLAGFICVWNQYPRETSRRLRYVFAGLKIAGAAILIYLMLTFRNGEGQVFGFRTSILGLIGWAYLICAVSYLIVRDRPVRLLAIFGVFVLVNILTSPLNEAYGSHPILDFPDGNFLSGFLHTIHVGNGGLCACTMGGLVLSVLGERYRGSDNKKLIVTLAGAAALAVAGMAAHHFYIVSKIAATLPWVCFSMAVACSLYGVFTWLDGRGLTGWFRIIRPAGTATLTAYMVPYLLYGIDNLFGINMDFFSAGISGLLNCALFSLVSIWITGLLEVLGIKLKI